jgi:hypothetical protein
VAVKNQVPLMNMKKFAISFSDFSCTEKRGFTVGNYKANLAKKMNVGSLQGLKL